MTTAPARLWHLPWLVAILWGFTRRAAWLPRVRSRLDDVMTLAYAIRRGWVRLVRSEGRIAGFMVRDDTLVHALYIHVARRRRGLGGHLIAEAKSEAAMLCLWVLQDNAPARAFYARHGFAEVTRSMGQGNDEGLPDILMTWRLTGESA